MLQIKPIHLSQSRGKRLHRKLLILAMLFGISGIAIPEVRGAATQMDTTFVFVKGGNFKMGEGAQKHQVTLSDYYIAKYDVTYGDFKEFVNAAKYQTIPEIFGKAWWYDETKNEITYKNGASWKNTGFKQTIKQPVVDISWYDAIKYCNWKSTKEGLKPVYTINEKVKDPHNTSDDEVDPFRWVITVDGQANGYRLPTEAEWEFAARSRGKDMKYAWGNEPLPEIKGRKFANVADESFMKKFPDRKMFAKYNDGYIFTSPVDKFAPNSLGLFDMTGNVWNWCWDWYDNYPKDSQINPKGAMLGHVRVARGGSWYNDPSYANVTYRVYSDPWMYSGDVGFRIVRRY